MVVIEHLYAELLCSLRENAYKGHNIVKVGCAGAVLRDKIRDSHVFASDLGVLRKNAPRVLEHIYKWNVSRDGVEAQLGAEVADLSCGVTVKSRKFNAVVAHIAQLGKSAAKVSLGILADGINLDSNRK